MMHLCRLASSLPSRHTTAAAFSWRLVTRWNASQEATACIGVGRRLHRQSATAPVAAGLAEDQTALAAASSQGRRPKRPWQQRTPYECPACGQQCFRAEVLMTHLERCCPDLLAAMAPPAPAVDNDTLRTWLEGLRKHEGALRQAALAVAFRQHDAEGNRLRQGPPEVAATLGLPPRRATRLLQAAMRAVPLAADIEHPVEVLWEDDDLIAVAKPAGVISAPKHRYTGGSMVNRIIGRLGFEPLTLHRLDQWTSGVLLFAKSRDVVPAIHEQFRKRTVEKRYLALAVGVPAAAAFSVNAPIDRDSRDKVLRCVHPHGKPALTDFKVLATSPGADLSAGATAQWAVPGLVPGHLGASLVSCKPHTGRTHQIRVHLAHAGHAIVGDDLYGITGPWLGRQALHAAGLSLLHPRTGRRLTLAAQLPDDIVAACQQLGVDCSCAMCDGVGVRTREE